MIHSEKGNPWEFDTLYSFDSFQIKYQHIYNFAKEGPVIGQIYINGMLVICPTKCDGFGGPPLITQECIYVPVYQKNILGFKDIMGAFVARIDLHNLSVKLIGKKHELINIVYLEKGKLYYYDSCVKNSRRIKYFTINDGFKSFTIWDKLHYIFDFIRHL